MVKKSVVKTYTGLREENLIRNNGKYNMYDKPLGTPIGLTTDVYYNEKGKPQQIHKGGLLGYTYDIDGEYGKTLNENYGRDVENLKHYSITNTKPNFSVNDYEGHDNYMSYVGEIYGKSETYAGHLAGMLGIREGLENLVYDVFPNAEGKTFADTINEILQYTDIQYAMEGEKVGIIRNIDVAKALGGVITTNVNNYSGKDTRLGMISNQMYARSLSHAAHFNSLRRTKYITQGLDKLYGNNLSNVYNLSSLFLLVDGQPRLIEPVTDSFIKEYDGQTIDNYLGGMIPDYGKQQEGLIEWNSRERYFGFSKSAENNEEISRRFTPNLAGEPEMVVSDMTKPSSTYRFFEEGDTSNGSGFNPDAKKYNAIDGFNSETIAISKEGNDVLNVTNKLFKNRLFDTLVGRFHTSNDKENNLIQSASHPIFGLSKGRNLLTRDAWENGKGENVNGYENPYCRVWTHHKQYSKMTDLIRPFTENGEFMGLDKLQDKWNIFRNYKGNERLGAHSVLNKNGMVNITPTDDLQVDVKQCMFSIENLAWKDVNISGKGGYRFENGDFVKDYQNTLSEEQRGPNGGRIMWFPPYDIDFQETSSADWHEDTFIGRGEPIYTYTNTKRSGSLSFTLLIDHPSVLNYWMLDKKDGTNSVNDEQTLLRYYAGCEKIDPSDDVAAKMLRGEYDRGDRNITPVIPDEDIIFNTYFPNNYSGVDVENKEDVLDVLFGGQYVNEEDIMGTLEEFANSGETLFLGYEMGLNPISAKFFAIPFSTPTDKTLVRVMNKEKADEEYKDKKFVEIPNSAITKEKFFEEGDVYVLYEGKESGAIKEKVEQQITTLTGTTIPNLETEKNKLYEEQKSLEAMLSGTTEGTVEYEMLRKDIRQKITEVSQKNFAIERCQDTLKTLTEQKENLDDIINKCNTVFGETNTQPFVKTEPIYCFYKSTEESKKEENETGKTENALSKKTEICANKKEAYAKYLLENTQECDSVKQYLQEYVKEKVCRIKKGKDEYEYYTADIKTSSNVVFDEFNTFENKRSFSKSAWPFGMVKTGKEGKEVTKYYYKNKKGNTKESDTKEDQVRILVRDEILTTFTNQNEFEKSNEICGCLDDTNQYVYYAAQKLSDKNAALQKIIEKLTDEEVGKAYEKHMYGAPTEIETDVDYWGIQYYCVYEKSAESGATEVNYETKQEYIIREKVDITKEPNITGTTTGWNAFGSIVDGEETIELETMVDYVTDASVKHYQYPHDKVSKDESLEARNYTDLQSFGLNSTYEVAREQDSTITCSFGEFYAACRDGVSGGTYTNFVLACEEAVLKTLKNMSGETLTEKINDARARIQYVAECLNNFKSKINRVTVLGDASKDGNDDKNDVLARNRAITVYEYLETLDIGDVLVDDTKGASEKTNGSGGCISDLASKKDRKVKTVIMIGADDNTTANRNETERTNSIHSQGFKEKQTEYRRYDDERLFFSMLKENDSIAYTNLVKKVRYFSPAYHSITPEGFNARLTFLQQCTRQGPTITASEVGTSGSTAANLAFGRAPFCVLRLGDFLNTKVVVRSVNITYPDSMWDINHDGIGAQFMLAKVTMNIDIIGGSDITAPIKRLQNAVSFNYYANTSIYDNRSDIGQYNGNDTSSDVRTWNPSLKPRQ